MKLNWEDQVVLVTGGTGSFGRKFVEIMLNEYRPQKLIVFSRDELKQHEMRAAGLDHASVRYFLGDVRDAQSLERALSGVTLVVHTAALKQVPACEHNPFEAIQTNIIGSKNLIDAAINRGVRRVIALSTDKAVHPTNLYGATKLCAEKMFVQANADGVGQEIRLSCVRSGNFLGSRSSVVPIFIEQRKRGKITITDPRMTRFWITLDRAARFVIRCFEGMHGGEIFVPKVPSMKLLDMAQALAPNCEIECIGTRPGEKLHEVLLSEEEARSSLNASDLFVIQRVHSPWGEDNWQGIPVAEGFTYASDTNSEWLTGEDLYKLVEGSAPPSSLLVNGTRLRANA
jgi:UDP-N-acetylglucosamine 4,6-dehydratase